MNTKTGLLLIVLLTLITACGAGTPTTMIAPATTPRSSPALMPSSEGQMPCDHPYFPIRPGAYWRYSLSMIACDGDCEDLGPELEWRAIDIQGTTDRANATILQDWGTITSIFTTDCDDRSVTTPLPLPSPGYPPCGLFLNHVDLLVPGYSWNGPAESSRGSVGGVAYSSAHTVTASSLSMIAGQRVNTLHISRVHHVDLLPGLGGVTFYNRDTVHTTQTSTIDLVRGIGIVRMTTTINRSAQMYPDPNPTLTSATLVAELTEYHIPP